MTTTDPLLLLRSALSSSSKINLLDSTGTEVFTLALSTSLSFPPYSPSTTFPKTTPTRYLTGAVAHGAARPSYDLQTLLHAYLQRDAPVQEYMRQSREGGVPFVSVTDRRYVVEYLGGKGTEEGEEGRVLPLGGAGEGAEGASAGAATATPAKRDADSTTAPAVTGDKQPSSSARPSDGAAPPSAKKARFVPNKEDQEKVKRMMDTIQGPVWGVETSGDQSGVSKAAALDKVGGVTQNRVTVLAGQRVNVSYLSSLEAIVLHQDES